ncbi:YecA family protein [Alkanindiges sp. WGS2144]|uniref:YecA/YgfB family protein n=1 Tax=Alkanindiges sp. WGS2144 TaxID=3366808 RepID=UPI003750B9BB
MATLDLELLADYLDGEKNEYGLDFAATHGFLCATVVGPELKNWLAQLFENDEAKVDPAIIAQIRLWRDDIQQTLINEETIEFPFEIEEASEDSSLGDWSVGFVDALFLNDEAWFAATEDEESIIMLTLPMMVFSGIEGEPEMDNIRRNGDLMDELAEEIPENLTKLYLLYHSPE